MIQLTPAGVAETTLPDLNQDNLRRVCEHHTIYTRNNMDQKCEGNCGLWVLNEMTKKISPGNLKKNCGCRLEVTC